MPIKHQHQRQAPFRPPYTVGVSRRYHHLGRWAAGLSRVGRCAGTDGDDFWYRAGSWDRARRVVAKVEWHMGELFPRLGFIVTNMTAGPEGVVRFYNGRGTAEQWIKEEKYALNWTRLSCHRFVPNRVRLSLFILAYNLGNFLRRLVLPKVVKQCSLRSVQVRLIKVGGRLVRHSRRLIFQLSEVSVPRQLFEGVLDRIGRLSPAPS